MGKKNAGRGSVIKSNEDYLESSMPQRGKMVKRTKTEGKRKVGVSATDYSPGWMSTAFSNQFLVGTMEEVLKLL